MKNAIRRWRRWGNLTSMTGASRILQPCKRYVHCTTMDVSVKTLVSKFSIDSIGTGSGGQSCKICTILCKFSNFSPDTARYVCAWRAQACQCFVFCGESCSSCARVDHGEALLAQSYAKASFVGKSRSRACSHSMVWARGCSFPRIS